MQNTTLKIDGNYLVRRQGRGTYGIVPLAPQSKENAGSVRWTTVLAPAYSNRDFPPQSPPPKWKPQDVDTPGAVVECQNQLLFSGRGITLAQSGIYRVAAE